tara:strand:- start:286 stop:948 length:663 start_codon:yes stop_codon:yes gene_type:complete
MKNTITCLLLLISTLAFSQQGQIQFGINYSEDNIAGSDYLITDGNANGYSLSNREHNYTLGLSFQYGFSENFSLITGVNYNSKDVKGGYNCATCYYNDLVITNYFVIPVRMKQRYLAIPIIVQFAPLQTRLYPTIHAGIVNNFSVENEFENEQSYLQEGQFGLGVGYKITKHLNVELQYAYRTAFTKVYQDLDVQPAYTDYEPNKLNTNSIGLRVNYILK